MSFERVRSTYVALFDDAFHIVAASLGLDRFFEQWPELGAPGEHGVPGRVSEFVRMQIGLARRDRSGESTALFLPTLLVHVVDLHGRTGPHVAATFERFAQRDPVSVARRTFGLTVREGEVLAFLLRGNRAEEIAAQLGLSVLTVRDYVKRLRAKTRARTQSGMIASLLGWTKPELSLRADPEDPR